MRFRNTISLLWLTLFLTFYMSYMVLLWYGALLWAKFSRRSILQTPQRLEATENQSTEKMEGEDHARLHGRGVYAKGWRDLQMAGIAKAKKAGFYRGRQRRSRLRRTP
jgi:hypothetical protein